MVSYGLQSTSMYIILSYHHDWGRNGDDSLILWMRWQNLRDKEHRILPPGMCKCTVGTWASVSCPLGPLLDSYQPHPTAKACEGLLSGKSQAGAQCCCHVLIFVKMHLLPLSENCMPHSLKSHPVNGSCDTAVVYCWARALEQRYLAN